MDQSHDSIVSMSEFRPMVVSPYMSPQLNETICGCRCGCGCGCAGDGDVDASERLSDSETAIESNESEDSEDLASVQCTSDDGVDGNDPGQTNPGVVAPRAMTRHFIVWLLGTSEDTRLNDALLGLEYTPTHPGLYDGNEGTTASPFSEACGEEDRINTVPSRGNLQTMSPGPGIGGWLHVVPERTRVERAQGIYILTPLRLSAE
ncbi:hypothetical protein OPT61_g2881 [Boeremia exigua]|uniref:Uncharacterized protein n=1 Tax=Boeremia exigua TaxID=749465 RepID=A0ACC2IJU1_9PLEO|nr:hypothetical protein OPT61_g2881 [Boeremia exigua]